MITELIRAKAFVLQSDEENADGDDLDKELEDDEELEDEEEDGDESSLE